MIWGTVGSVHSLRGSIWRAVQRTEMRLSAGLSKERISQPEETADPQVAQGVVGLRLGASLWSGCGQFED